MPTGEKLSRIHLRWSVVFPWGGLSYSPEMLCHIPLRWSLVFSSGWSEVVCVCYFMGNRRFSQKGKPSLMPWWLHSNNSIFFRSMQPWGCLTLVLCLLTREYSCLETQGSIQMHHICAFACKDIAMLSVQRVLERSLVLRMIIDYLDARQNKVYSDSETLWESLFWLFMSDEVRQCLFIVLCSFLIG